MLRRAGQLLPFRHMSTSSKLVLLTSAERSDLLPTLPKWKPNAEQTSISRALKFSDFNETWGFMSRVALRAEKLNHHPEWKNVRPTANQVDVGIQCCRYHVDDAFRQGSFKTGYHVGAIH